VENSIAWRGLAGWVEGLGAAAEFRQPFSQVATISTTRRKRMHRCSQ